MINLEEKHFLAKGGERTCYINPLNSNQIIKVLHLKDKHNNQNELEYRYYQFLKNKNIDFSHITQCYGWIETNYGKGLVFDRVLDYNGKDSKYFRHYLKNNLLDEKTEMELVSELKLYLEINKILFIDVSTVNLFCQEIEPKKFRLVIFDGLGARRLGIKFHLYLRCKSFVKYKIKKQWKRFLENYKRDKICSIENQQHAKKKIVYISRSIIPSRTANSINVIKMCNAFASLGYDVTLLAPSTKKLEEKDVINIFDYYGVEENFKLKKLYSPNIKNLRKKIYSLRCLYEVKQIKPDLVYGREDMFAFYLTQQNGFKTIFEQHEPYVKNDFEQKMFKKFIDANNHSYKVVTISEKLKQIYSQQYNIQLDSILVVQSATSIEFDTSLPDNYREYSNRINIGYIGSLFKGRGIEIIIQLAELFPSINFHIVGGKNNDIEYWKTESKDLGNLIFHGFINPKDTYKYRNMCDILLAPYQTNEDGNRNSEYMSPIKIFEYMASKKAIICSNMDAIKETINDTHAILVDHKNIDEWKNAITYLIDNPKKREELSQSAYTYCLENFTYEARCKKVLEFVKIND